ncbi:coiled-coil domain-containing protein 60-like [Triplophysa rosa]|uniref:coiled-coil domain-containing protein 60-like n=1 Tax=Triplophysa rosa TaxID=992332 RepID=UPI002545F233|nr:coiled-coil domain-containing protein 60-like [Triplophysa rosa]
MEVQSDVSLDSRPCVVVKTLLPSKLCDFEMFWERFNSRQKPLTCGAYSSLGWSYTEDVSEPLHLEPKRLLVSFLGQLEKAPKGEISEVDDDLDHETPLHSSQENEKLPPKYPRFQKREDTVLRKHLRLARQHSLAVKQGRSYFHLLQKEEQEAQEERATERRRKKELRLAELRPPAVSSDSDEDNDIERWCDFAASSSSEMKCNRRKIRSVRPFTPVHRSLTSAQPHQLPRECVYRQLCCLTWLLEALTLDHSGKLGPLTFCWDAKDPGRSRTTIKRLNKEKAIEAKWEQFIATPKPRHVTSKPLRVSSGRHLTLKTSSLSVVSSLASASSVGSLSSFTVAPDFTCSDPVSSDGFEALSARKPDSDPSPSECSNVSVKVQPEREPNTANEKTKFRTQSIKRSFPVGLSSATQLVREKEAMLDAMKASFGDKAEELMLSLSDALERSAKKRWDNGVQRYLSLCNMTSHGQIPSVTCLPSAVSTATAQDSKVTDAVCSEDPYSTQWLSELLSSLTPIKHSDRRVACLLEKLSRFTEGLTLRVHPHSFLRVLNSLPPWELCCPDLCVSIEIVRDNAVKMPKAEYDSWLHRRLSQSQTTKSVTHNIK